MLEKEFIIALLVDKKKSHSGSSFGSQQDQSSTVKPNSDS